MLLLCASVIASGQGMVVATGSSRIQGKVLDVQGKGVAGALVHLHGSASMPILNVQTDAQGTFEFAGLAAGSYTLDAENDALRSQSASVQITPTQSILTIDLKLAPANAAAQTMQFADDPNFTVAGVTDWTAAGGHGSDSSLRTSEALTRETLALRSKSEQTGEPVSAASQATESALRAQQVKAPKSFDANHRLGRFYLDQGRYKDALPWLRAAYGIDPANVENELDLAKACQGAQEWPQAREHVAHLLAARNTADIHRLAAEIDEASGDPLAAVHEYEAAAKLDPSEQNYFDWGSELLLHRAVLQARQVFEQGVKAYPHSSRMLVALGGALFAGALYDDAARRLCEASDLDPSQREPYLFMGKIEIAAPDPLTCVEEKLGRFVQLYPDDSLAHYFYAMALWKQAGTAVDAQHIAAVQAQLLRAVALDPKCADAYLQLGNLSATQRNFKDAVDDYQKAIHANPKLAEAYYRLGVAYDRLGQREQAAQQFALHDAIRKEQAADVERQRKEIKQFLVAPAHSSTQTP